jgi:hypothetical protein
LSLFWLNLLLKKQVVRRPEQEGFCYHQGPERHPRDGQAGGLQAPQERIREAKDGRNQNERSLVKVSEVKNERSGLNVLQFY